MYQRDDHTLIDRIYEAAVIPEIWEDVLSDLTHVSESFGAVFISIDGDETRWLSSSADFEEIVSEHYRRFPGLNDRAVRLLESRTAGFVRDTDVFEAAEIQTLPLFADFLLPRGLGRGIATSISSPSGEAMIIHIEGDYRKGPFSDQAVHRLDLIRPHLARASLLSTRLRLKRASVVVQTLQTLGLPGVLLKRNGTVVAANELFEDHIPERFQDRRARMELCDGRADSLLNSALLQLDAEDGSVRSIALTRTKHLPPAVLHLIPIRRQAHDVFGLGAIIGLITPLISKKAVSADIIQGLFDLTAAEAKVAEKLGNNLSATEIAALNGTSIVTVRNQISSVLNKSGFHRQVDLVALLQSVSPPRKS